MARAAMLGISTAAFALLVACTAVTSDEEGAKVDERALAGGEISAPPVGGEESGENVVDGSGREELPPSFVVEEEPGSEDGGVTSPAPDAGASTPDAGTSSSSGGTSSSSGGTSSSSGGTSVPGCTVTRTGGTGNEPSGNIPVCCAPSASQKQQIDELFALLNAYRAEKGKPALQYDTKLEATIQGHCEHMRLHGFFDHFAPEKVVETPPARASLCGTTASGENIASGQSSPSAVMAAWKNSSGHDTNMLANWKRVGLCRAGSAWGQIFGN